MSKYKIRNKNLTKSAQGGGGKKKFARWTEIMYPRLVGFKFDFTPVVLGLKGSTRCTIPEQLKYLDLE